MPLARYYTGVADTCDDGCQSGDYQKFVYVILINAKSCKTVDSALTTSQQG